MTMPVRREDFTLVRGQTYRRIAERDGPASAPSATLRLAHLQRAELRRGRLNIKPGTLDDTAWLRPEEHYWVRGALDWVPVGTCRHETE